MNDQKPPVLNGAQPAYAATPEPYQDAYQLGRATAIIRFLISDMNYLIARCADPYATRNAETTIGEATDFLTEEGIRQDERNARVTAFLAQPVLDDVMGA